MEYAIIGVKTFKTRNTVSTVSNGSVSGSTKEISRMVVEITIRRKIQYHVTNTFLQVSSTNSRF